MSTHASPTFIRPLREAGVTFVLALIVFGPISGLVLDGYSIEPHLGRPLLIASIVAAGRLLFGVLEQTPFGQKLLARNARKASGGVTVARGDEYKLLYFVVPLVIAIGVTLPFVANKYWLGNLILALIYVLLGLGLNIVVGLAGLLDLGFVAFYAVGAYFLALGAQYLDIGFWTALVCAPMLAACFGAVLGFPVLRMHGDYLAIVTLGFGEIIRLVLNNWLDFTGGPNGASVPAPTIFGLEFSRIAKQGGTPFHEFFGLEYSSDYKLMFTYLVLLVVVLLMVRFLTKLRQMPMGRAWEALREDEIACRSLGINHVIVKLSAFMMGAMTGGLAGVFFATYQGFVNPTSFNFFESALILAIVVLGGLGSTLGVIIAALVLTLLPEVLREFADYRVLAFGALMVLMMIWRPRGLIRPKRPHFAPEV
ncbi:high-affinity branched-chain amino acid ABC transporter permease LivM [Plasticicumulans acidivorans]|uniref:Amino acid/amide ABC transporter membrane protein 2 (HAAT family) n=1 Tax=Plasticicumulans acidivorans TaxID=886464 RepID=A0A317MUU1_9GAMM|nr:high-affinity branched-chain amino acid ABC transporter permease LivM [Plasticicumulans acidivorans]PWV60610.1 amino acid/amide ABC transporter membrane protein 2 (HAAT family) [Plasticicumulans acidivorans]